MVNTQPSLRNVYASSPTGLTAFSSQGKRTSITQACLFAEDELLEGNVRLTVLVKYGSILVNRHKIAFKHDCLSDAGPCNPCILL